LEPVTHFLTGAVLARAGFNRKTALATATMSLAAEAPDLDTLWSFKGPVVGFAHHRGFTHSFLGLILVSSVVVGIVYAIWLLRGRRTNIPGLRPRWGLLFFFAYIAGLSHILLDFTNNYGVRPFWPFSERWYSWDVAFIVEPPFYLFLLAGLLVPEFVPRRPRPGFRSGTAAILALLCMLILWTSRSFEASSLANALGQQSFSSESPLHVSVYPYWIRASQWKIALHWSTVVETRSVYLTSGVNTAERVLDTSTLSVFPKLPDTPVILAAKRTYLGRVYVDWAKYPVVTEVSEEEESVVYFRDLRFAYPEWRRGTVLSASVRLDRSLHMIGEAMGPREQRPPLD
jgi:inner membrane protein